MLVLELLQFSLDLFHHRFDFVVLFDVGDQVSDGLLDDVVDLSDLHFEVQVRQVFELLLDGFYIICKGLFSFGVDDGRHGPDGDVGLLSFERVVVVV